MIRSKFIVFYVKSLVWNKQASFCMIKYFKPFVWTTSCKIATNYIKLYDSSDPLIS
jgi:hypothetical protein